MTVSDVSLHLSLRDAFPFTAEPEDGVVRCVVIGVHADALNGPAAVLDHATDGFLQRLLTRGDFDPRVGETLLVPEMIGPHTHGLLVGLGEAVDFDAVRYARAAQAAAVRVLASATRNVVWPIWAAMSADVDLPWAIRQCAVALHGAAYRVSPSPSLDARLIALVVDAPDRDTHRIALRQGEAIGRGIALCRELGDLPANVCTPAYLANVARTLARPDVLDVDVFDEASIDAMGMNAFLSVSAGSDELAQLVVMSYRGAPQDEPPVVLIGKGVTFDSGGISLKPAKDMDQMKFDMCGAAAVIGTVHAAAEMALERNVIGIVAATENLSGGRATKPGDVVQSLSGKTIEILNTDAEGRLILCDILTYARRFDPEIVIDVATLTGACVTALGHAYSGLFSRDDTLAGDLIAAGSRAIDPVWRMPLDGPYEEELTSKFADLANIGSGVAGSVVAATFLSQFAEGYAWAHLDVAGTASRGGKEKGATGRPVPLLVEFLMSRARASVAACDTSAEALGLPA